MELRSLDLEKYRRALALVSQEPTLYQGGFINIQYSDLADW